MDKASPFVLGFFPKFSNGHFGGIQESARVAWDAIADTARTELICYERTKEPDSYDKSGRDSRLRTIFSALSNHESLDLVLIWQIGFVKLLPFLRQKPGKIALFLHGIEAWRKQNWVMSRLTNRVGLFLSNSDYTWERFLIHNPSLSKVVHQTIRLGIRIPLSYDTVQPIHQPTALMLSRLLKSEDYKGHREVIDAWPLVLQDKSAAKLWIAGDGDLRPELESYVRRLGLQDSVKFFGEVSEQKKQELLEQSCCLLMPSRNEGFGLVYLEAMRLGRPCLVSTMDAGREVVNPPEAGLAVDPNDRRAVADAVSRLISNGDEWTTWSEQARRRYESKFTATHFQQRLVAALFPESN